MWGDEIINSLICIFISTVQEMFRWKLRKLKVSYLSYFLSDLHQIVPVLFYFFFSFYWINLNLDRISPLISTITVHDHYMAVETGYWIIQNDIQIIVEYLWKWAVCNRVLIGTQGLVQDSEVGNLKSYFWIDTKMQKVQRTVTKYFHASNLILTVPVVSIHVLLKTTQNKTVTTSTSFPGFCDTIETEPHVVDIWWGDDVWEWCRARLGISYNSHHTPHHRRAHAGDQHPPVGGQFLLSLDAVSPSIICVLEKNYKMLKTIVNEIVMLWEWWREWSMEYAWCCRFYLYWWRLKLVQALRSGSKNQ